MPNPFQDFIQLELPKRPFLETDTATETVFVRRGVAPRQMATVSLNDGEVLGKVAGVIQGVVPATAEGIEHVQAVANVTWTISHNKNNIKYIVQVVDDNNDVIVPDNIRVEANTATLTFTAAQSGRANLMFY